MLPLINMSGNLFRIPIILYAVFILYEIILFRRIQNTANTDDFTGCYYHIMKCSFWIRFFRFGNLSSHSLKWQSLPISLSHTLSLLLSRSHMHAPLSPQHQHHKHHVAMETAERRREWEMGRGTRVVERDGERAREESRGERGTQWGQQGRHGRLGCYLP